MNALGKGSPTPLRISPLRISWASDLHFDHAKEGAIEHFFHKLLKQHPRVLLLAGDLDMAVKNPHVPLYGTIPAEGLISTLKKIHENIACKIFFVCGNHDFYFSSFQEVREEVKKLCEENPMLTYVHETTGIELEKEVVLVGHDGWGDGREGQFFTSNMVLTDFFHIKDFNLQAAKDIFTEEIKEKLGKLGEESALYAKKVLPAVFKKYKTAIFLTHVPPFREASRHKSSLCDDESAPFFVNQILGKAVVEIMKEYPEKQLIVLCGHTHTPAVFQPLPNVTVFTAGAEYGDPEPQDPLFI